MRLLFPHDKVDIWDFWDTKHWSAESTKCKIHADGWKIHPGVTSFALNSARSSKSFWVVKKNVEEPVDDDGQE